MQHVCFYKVNLGACKAIVIVIAPLSAPYLTNRRRKGPVISPPSVGLRDNGNGWKFVRGKWGQLGKEIFCNIKFSLCLISRGKIHILGLLIWGKFGQTTTSSPSFNRFSHVDGGYFPHHGSMPFSCLLLTCYCRTESAEYSQLQMQMCYSSSQNQRQLMKNWD